MVVLALEGDIDKFGGSSFRVFLTSLELIFTIKKHRIYVILC